MKLKEKILNKAVELFNERGISSTSPNQIAAALEISPGNLTYHFNTKAILVKEIYELMYAHSQDFIKVTGYLTLADFRQTMEKFQDFKKIYSFFFHDIAFIVRNYPEAGKLIEAANMERFKQARLLFEYYIETGRMIPEEDEINYDCLIHNVWTVAAFWDVQRIIIPPEVIFQKPMNMVEMTWHMILPYLTKKGLEEHDQINDFLKSHE
jgi:AcrR family transcriptional regulator